MKSTKHLNQENLIGKIKPLCVFVLFLGVLFAYQSPACAGVALGFGFGGRWHHGGVSIAGYVPLEDYYVARQYYYPYYHYYPVSTYSYIVESAPLGAVVYAIPAGCREMVVNGVHYFEYYGTYYVPVAGGYQVVAPPVIVPPPAVAAQPNVINTELPSTNKEEEFSVNIPNDRGGYTSVTLKRSGSGFIGPQGEFYNEFPPVKQLRIMYGK